MTDIQIIPFDFNSTTITFNAITEKGKELFSQMFGLGAVSVDLPKSKGMDFETFVIQKGLSIA